MAVDDRPFRVVGLIPAAGRATRVSPLPCSKELFPVGFRDVDGQARPKVACHYLLDQFRRAHVSHAYLVLGNGKWDIPAYFDDGAVAGVDLAYLTVRRSRDPVETVDRAWAYVRHAIVVFGFPDILSQPTDAFRQLLDRQAATAADVVLGLFPADRAEKMDMAEVDDAGRVRNILVKPTRTDLRLTWIMAVWTPAFTEFLHAYRAGRAGATVEDERHVGHVLQAAIDEHLRIDSVTFPGGRYIDIGTPEDLARAVRAFA